MSNALRTNQFATAISPHLPHTTETPVAAVESTEMGLSQETDLAPITPRRSQFVDSSRIDKFDRFVECTLLLFASAPAIGLMVLLGIELLARLS